MGSSVNLGLARLVSLHFKILGFLRSDLFFVHTYAYLEIERDMFSSTSRDNRANFIP